MLAAVLTVSRVNNVKIYRMQIHLIQFEVSLYCFLFLKLVLPGCFEVDYIHQHQQCMYINHTRSKEFLDFT